MKGKPLNVCVAILAAVAIALASFGAGGGRASAARPAAAQSAKSATLTIGLSVGSNANPAFDPAKAQAGPSMLYLQPVYDTLIHQDSTGKFTAGLATKWHFLKSTSFEMTLRTGLKFADGAPFNAAAVKANLDYYRHATGPVTAQLSPVDRVKVVSPTVVRLTLSTPDPTLPLVLSQVMGMMVSPKKVGSSALNTAPDGIGPYTLSTSASTLPTLYTYVRHSGFWDAREWPFAKIVIKVVPDAQSLFSDLQTGAIDAMPGTLPNVARAQSAGFQILKEPVNSVGLFLVDRRGQMAKPLGDVRVRQALNYAVDRKALLSGVLHGLGRVTDQIIPPGAAGYSKKLDTYYSYNPAKAKQLLAAAGYPHGFTLQVLSNPLFDVQLQAIGGFLQAVGVTLDIKDQAPPVFATNITTTSNPAYFFTYAVQDTFADGQTLFGPTGALNPFHASDSVMNKLLRQGAAVRSAKARDALYRQLSQRVVQQAWFDIVYQSDYVWFVNKKAIKGDRMWPHMSYPWLRGWSPA